MHLTLIDRVDNISPEDFRKNYLLPGKPLIISRLSERWPAYTKWTWDYFKSLVGDQRVGVYNNARAGAKMPVNGADDTMLFGDYLDLIQKGPVELRIFAFNIFKYAPGLTAEFQYPEEYVKTFLKHYPMLFVGGAGSIAHMHYDIDLPNLIHTQFIGKKRVLLIPHDQSQFMYRLPMTAESGASFVNWHEGVDEEKFPALAKVKGMHGILEHGETLFMPSGCWHHMQYMESGFAMSLRAFPEGFLQRLNSLYHVFPMRGMNNLLIKIAPEWWYHKKRELARATALQAMKQSA